MDWFMVGLIAVGIWVSFFGGSGPSAPTDTSGNHIHSRWNSY